MQTLAQRLESYVGTIGPDDTVKAEQFLSESAKQLINLLPVPVAEKVAKLDSVGTSFDTVGSRVISVLGTTDGYRARFVPHAQFLRGGDTRSLHYVTASDPSYTILSRYLFTRPISCQVFHIPYPYIYFTDSYVDYFPMGLDQAVVVGAAIDWLTGMLVQRGSEIPTTLPTPPSAPTLQNLEVGALPTAPVFPVTPFNVATGIDLSTHLTKVQGYLETDEDIELAKGKMEETALRLQEYVAEIQGQSKKFEADVLSYKAELDKVIKNVELLSQEDTLSINRYHAQVLAYTAETKAVVERFMSSVQSIQFTTPLIATLRQEWKSIVEGFLSNEIPANA